MAASVGDTRKDFSRVQHGPILIAALGVSVLAGAAIAKNPFSLILLPALMLGVVLATTSLPISFSFLFVARTLSDTKLVPGSVSNVINLLIIVITLVLFGLMLIRTSNRPGYVSKAIALMTLAWTLLAVGQLSHSVTTLIPVFRLVSIIAIACLAAAIIRMEGNEAFLRRLLWLTLPSAIIMVIGSLLQVPAFTTPERGAFGTFSHKNSASTFFAILGVACLYVALTRRWKISVVEFVLACIASILAVSLGGTTALAVGCLIILWTPGVPVPPLARSVITVLLIATSIFVIRDTSISNRITELSTEGVYVANQGDQSNSLNWRLLNWSLLRDLWASRPVLGWGFGTTETNRSLQPLGTLPHSEPVRFLVETGVVGCFAILTLLFSVLRGLDLRGDGGLRLALLGVVITNALTSNTLGYVPAMYLFVSFWQATGNRIESSGKGIASSSLRFSAGHGTQ